MTTPLNKDTKAVLKLDLGNHGVRRIYLAKLWDESSSAISYNRLVELAMGFSDLKAVQNNQVSVAITYIDEDGDEITISSDEELADAFNQFVDSEPPVVRAKAVIVATKKVVAVEHSKTKNRVMQNRVQNHNAINNAFHTGLNNLNQVETKSPIPPVVRLPPVVPPKKQVTSVSKKNHYDDAVACDPNFIHGRHTCDGCLSTPIFGIRYHATNLPDYDLCSSCHSNYQGKDIIFKPMQLDRDRHLQSRWQRRRLRRCLPMSRTQGLGSGLESGTQTRRVIGDMDGALKEAIRRSLVDSFPKEKKESKEPEEEEKSSVKAEPTESVEESVVEGKVVEEKNNRTVEEIPVAAEVTVEDSGAGNRHTQEVLDKMDPKVKEALRRSLNDFFLRRANCNEGSKGDVLKKNDNEQSKPCSDVETTQKKIDSMDSAMKEAVRRSLNQFFATRRARKQSEREFNDGIVRAQEIKDTMDQETREKISHNLNEFFARRLTKKCENGDENVVDNEMETHALGEKKSTEDVPVVAVDIVDDDNDDDLSEETHYESSADTDLDNDSIISEDSDSSVKNEEWHMVTEDDEMIAAAAQMLGSALLQSDTTDSCHSI